MKKNLVFYYHYCNAHNQPGSKMLRVKYGWSGEGRYYALLNMIGDSEYCVLDMSKKFIAAVYAEALGLSLDEFKEFVNYLVIDCELLIRVNQNVDKNVDNSVDNWLITSELLQENFTEIMRLRDKARQRKAKNEVENSGSDEKQKSSRELSEGLPELNNKERKREKKKIINKGVDSVDNSLFSFGSDQISKRMNKIISLKALSCSPYFIPP